jgi:hypothetical protein
MKEIIVEFSFVIKDKDLDPNSPIGNISLDYLEKHGTRIYEAVTPKQLYNVQVPENIKTIGIDKHPVIDGCIAMYGQKVNYTKSEAIKKARVFGGKVIENKE